MCPARTVESFSFYFLALLVAAPLCSLKRLPFFYVSLLHLTRVSVLYARHPSDSESGLLLHLGSGARISYQRPHGHDRIVTVPLFEERKLCDELGVLRVQLLARQYLHTFAPSRTIRERIPCGDITSFNDWHLSSLCFPVRMMR